MSILWLATSALLLGFMHGLGADHLMAIAAMTADGRRKPSHTRVLSTAVGFAVGHTVVLALGATIAIAFGFVVPATVSAGAERAAGLMLIALGAFGVWTVTSGRTFGHIHAETDGRTRWHLHLGGASARIHGIHPHSLLPAVMGAMFALSSLRTLMLLQPFGADARALALPALVLLIGLFGVGILLSMSLFGVVLARVFSLPVVDALGRWSAGLVAAASVLVGAYWLLA
jgi:hypothetical protein